MRLINTRNLEAIANIVLRAMKLGFYAGFNFNLVICEDCGFRPAPAHDDHDIECCPHCHSHNIMMINRLCGYIGYGKRNGESRFNDSKLAEVGERKSM